MTKEEYAQIILKRFAQLRAERSRHENLWRDLRDYVRPDTVDIHGYRDTSTDRHRAILDGTAQDAAEELAAGLISFAMNPADRWFTVVPRHPNPNILFSRRVGMWCEDISDLIYSQYQLPHSGSKESADECMLDIVAFGTGAEYQDYDYEKGCLSFRSTPVTTIWCAEGRDGRIDAVYRKIPMTLRQMVTQFGDLPKKLSEKIAKEPPDRLYHVIHAQFPRSDRDLMKITPQNKPYASVWVCEETKEVLLDSGADYFKYHIPRWRKLSNEHYGVPPGAKCINNIRMLNSMKGLIIKAGTRQVDPPMILEDDGFLLPIKTEPGSINYKMPGASPVEFMRFEGNLPFAQEEQEQERAFIRKCYHNDWLRLEKQNVEMTAYEVQDRRDEKMRLLAPNLGRLESEWLGPRITLSYKLLARAGKIPPAPPELEGVPLGIEYSSPAARAQLGIKVIEMDKYIQRLIPLSQIQPDILDNFDGDEYAQALAVYQGTPRRIVRDPKRVAEIRQQRQDAEMAANAAAIAEPASKAIKNLADAGAVGGL